MQNITTVGSDARVVGTKTRWKRTAYASEITKHIVKPVTLLAVLSHLRILYQLKYVNRKNMNKKILKATLLWTNRSVGSTKKIRIQNRNLQTCN